MPITINTVDELTDAIVKTKYEGNADTNAYTDAEVTKLAGIEANATADQTAAEVSVAATATNYTAGTADVEAHLAAVDTALGAIAAAGVSDGDKGDITVSGTGTVWTIDNDAVNTIKIIDEAVTFPKIVDMNATTLLGNPLGVAASPQNITLGTNLSFAGSVLNASGGFVHIDQGKGQLIAAAGSTYVQPAALGNAGVLTIADWGSFKSMTIQVIQGEDYDNGANDFTLEIVDASGNSNTWDTADDVPAFDLVIPKSFVWDAGPTVLSQDALNTYSIAQTPFDNAPVSAITWAAGTLTMTFGGADFKGKSRNVITIG